MNKKLKFAAFIAVLVLAGVIFRSTPLAQAVSKDSILAFFQTIRHEWWGPVVFILIYGIGCVIALPGSLLTLTGGAVFGMFWGTIYNVLAANFGASLAFFTARYLGRDFIQGLLKNGKLADFDKGIQSSGFKTIFRLRLIPVVPFNGLNFGAGLSSVKYRDYLLGSFLGMLPGTFIYTYFADALLQGVQGANQKAFLNLLIASLLLVLISFLPAIYKRIQGARYGKV
ncbi:MAG: hypothetical protein A3A81_03870 [Omnitrophica bacterium RIFCSPLOWO2_01_FULL_45_10b]|nr:MAG: hypothetical protein A3A81_03870 [Omnitrophica bacterium RIFCSPLOWO2_01_FULL_45_10b]